MPSIYAVFLLLLAVQPVFSQQITPEPIDLLTLFADGVQVVLLENVPPYFASEDLSYIDEKSRTIYLRTSLDDTWQTFPFPPDADVINCAEPRTNGTWIIQDYCDPSNDNGAESDWILDVRTREYIAPQTICGDYIKALPSEGEWVLMADATGQTNMPCFTETGQTIRLFPRTVIGRSITTSPDGQWLVVIAEDQASYRSSIYSHRLVTGQIILLGTPQITTFNPVISIEDWVDATHGTILERDEFLSWLSQDYYTFDVTQPDSLKFAFSAWESRYKTFFHTDDPVSYASITTYDQIEEELRIVIEEQPCQLTVYNATGLQRYEVGSFCIPLDINDFGYAMAYQAGERLYYLAGDDEVKAIRLEEFDLLHNTRRTVWAGVVGIIYSASPDGRYLLVLINDGLSSAGSWIAVLDLATSGLVAFQESRGTYTRERVRWLDAQTFVLISPGERLFLSHPDTGEFYVGVQHPPQIIRVHFDENGSIQTESVTISPELGDYYPGRIFGHFWLTERSVFDLYSFEHTPLVRDELPDGYTVSLNWYDTKTIQADVKTPDEQTISYLVAIP